MIMILIMIMRMIIVLIMIIKLYIFMHYDSTINFFCQTKNSTETFQGHVVKLTLLFVTNIYRLFAKINYY